MSSLLCVNELYYTYREGKVSTPVLKGVNLEVSAGELTAVIGKSGSGKSTLLHVIATLDRPDSGSVLFDGTELTALSSPKQARFRNRSLGFVYQFHHLLNDLSALENVALPLSIGNVKQTEALNRARAYLKKVGLEGKETALPPELSGGERQRVAIARALVHHPRLILADEPTGNLDADNSERILSLFLDLVRSEGSAVIMVTHDLALASRADSVYRMVRGKVERDA